MKTRKVWGLAEKCMSAIPIAAGGLLLGAAQVALADPCMQDQWQLVTYGTTETNQTLNCTANDVELSGVSNLVPVSGLFYDENGDLFCYQDSPITFTADFDWLLQSKNGQERYDLGAWLATDGGDALTGMCDSTIISGSGAQNYHQLDPAPDTCGDISNIDFPDYNPQTMELTVSMTCSGTGGNVDLGNCTAWRQPGANDVCTSIEDAIAGTKSKCNCGVITLPISVETPNLGITKSANPTSCDEPGCDVEYTVVISNPAVVTPVDLTRLTEDDTNNGSVDIDWTDSTSPTLADICNRTTLAPCGTDSNNCAAESYATCIFTRPVTGNAGDNITDEACIYAENGGPLGPFCDTATVSINDVGPEAAVVKGENGAACAVVNYTVEVVNNSAAEPADLTALCDNQFGDLSSGGNSDPSCTAGPEESNVRSTTCVLPQALAKSDGNPGGSDEYTCGFVAEVCTFPHTNTVTATLSDDDGNTITRNDGLSVTSVTITSSP